MNHYDVLGVRADTTAAALRAAYRQRARAAHPDRPGGSAASMRAVNEAWHTLSDPARRAAYDQSLRDAAAASAPRAQPATAARPRTHATDSSSVDDRAPIPEFDDAGRVFAASPRLRLLKTLTVAGSALLMLLALAYAWAFYHSP